MSVIDAIGELVRREKRNIASGMIDALWKDQPFIDRMRLPDPTPEEIEERRLESYRRDEENAWRLNAMTPYQRGYEDGRDDGYADAQDDL